MFLKINLTLNKTFSIKISLMFIKLKNNSLN